MNLDKYERQISLVCPTCGSTHFEFDSDNDDDEQPMKCSSCGRTTSKRELMEENAENIEEHINEVSNQALDEVAKHLTDSLKKMGFK